MIRIAPIEVLVIGGGVAALCAAIAARRAGAQVVLLEQAPLSGRGGNTRHARNFRVAHAIPTPLTPGIYDNEAFWQDLFQVTAGMTNEALARQFIHASTQIVDWLSMQGARFQTIADGVLPVSRKTVFLLGGGTALINALYASAERLGVQIFYANAVQNLEIHATPWMRVTVQSCSSVEWLYARTIIAACGGFQANVNWLQRYWGNAAKQFINRGTPFANGTVLAALIAQGAAQIGNPSACHLVAVDARSPQTDGGIVTRVRGIPQGIVVNHRCERFYDEGADTASTRYAIWGQQLAKCAGQRAYLILDAIGERLTPPVLFPPIMATCLLELADNLSLNPQHLIATVTGFNAAMQNGCSVNLHPAKSQLARPVIVPPFAAYPLAPGITFTYLGVQVDARARVRMCDGSIRANLFAAGPIMLANLLGQGYLSGLAVTVGAVFGRIAGIEAAHYARWLSA